MMKNKALYIIMIIAIILGAIIIKVKGFNYGTLYSEHKRLEIIIGADFDLDDSKKIVDETIKSDHVSRKATLYGTTLVIDAKDFSESELTNLFNKLNEKYSKEYTIGDLRKNDIIDEMNLESIDEKSDEEIQTIITEIKEKYGIEYTKEQFLEESSKLRMTSIPQTSMWDVVKDFIKPLAISLIIVMVYFGIRYFKLYKHAWLLEPIKLAFNLILNQCFLISILAIARIPIAAYVPSLLLILWILQLVAETIKAEQKLREIKSDD